MKTGNKIWIYGKHTVLEAIKNEQRNVLQKVATYEEDGFEKKDINWFNTKFGTEARHQNTAALVEEFEENSIEDILAFPRVLILDQITDPQNFGAIIRSAAVFGFNAVIIMQKNSVTISQIVYKIASGGMEYVRIIKVTNISTAIQELKENEFWVLGMDENGGKLLSEYRLSPTDKIALVIGAEGTGMRRLVRENCDEVLRIASSGQFSTLNASNAACVAMSWLMPRNNF